MDLVRGYNDNQLPAPSGNRMICRFYKRGMCRFGNRCRNLHSGPTSSSSEIEHVFKPIEKAAPPPNDASLTMECGICFDIILQKEGFREQTFGILPNCNHCFCFSCIRKWRQSKEFDFDVSKACPECRKPSEYVYPSKVWFELAVDKENFIAKEKSKMQELHCKYFARGKGMCPFGNTCLYLHALPNGVKKDVGPPRPRRRRVSNIDSEVLHQILYMLTDDDDDGDEYDDLEMDLDDEDDYDDLDDLDLDDPTIAMQYYDHDDIRRYIAISQLMGPDPDDGSDESDGDYELPIFT